MQSGADAKPTVEALENERRRLRELERNLAAERDRVHIAAAREIAHLQDVLRDAADRAARRERELEITRKRLERKLAGGRLGRLVGLRRRAVEEQAVVGDRDLDQAAVLEAQARALAARADELTAREVQLEQKVDELVDAERRSVEQLAARAAALDARQQAGAEPARRTEPLVDRSTILDAREAELMETIAELEQRERELAVLRDQLDAESSRLAARSRRLGEVERHAPIRTAYRAQAVGFREGLRALARKRGARFD